jgi:hypothetical protein
MKNTSKLCQRGPLVRVGRVLRDSFLAYFYKHETTYRGLKFHKAEQFNIKLLFENTSQNMHLVYKKNIGCKQEDIRIKNLNLLNA